MYTLTYKDYSAEILFDWEELAYVGKVVKIHDVIFFRGATVEEAEQDFRRAIDSYTAACKNLGLGPLEAA